MDSKDSQSVSELSGGDSDSDGTESKTLSVRGDGSTSTLAVRGGPSLSRSGGKKHLTEGNPASQRPSQPTNIHDLQKRAKDIKKLVKNQLRESVPTRVSRAEEEKKARQSLDEDGTQAGLVRETGATDLRDPNRRKSTAFEHKDFLFHPEPDTYSLMVAVQMCRLACQSPRFVEKFQANRWIGGPPKFFNKEMSKARNRDHNDNHTAVHGCAEKNKIQLESWIYGTDKASCMEVAVYSVACDTSKAALSSSDKAVDIYFAFASKMSFVDHFQDLRVIPQKYNSKVIGGYAESKNKKFKGARVYSGPHELYEGVRTQLLNAHARMCVKYGATVGIAVTGHSLGGAVATYFLADLLSRGFRDVRGITFGSPKVGNRPFVRLLHHRIRETNSYLYRVYVLNDLPTLLPPSAPLVGLHFNHAGCPVMVNAAKLEIFSYGPDSRGSPTAVELVEQVKNLRAVYNTVKNEVLNVRYLGVKFSTLQWLALKKRQTSALRIAAAASTSKIRAIEDGGDSSDEYEEEREIGQLEEPSKPDSGPVGVEKADSSDMPWQCERVETPRWDDPAWHGDELLEISPEASVGSVEADEEEYNQYAIDFLDFECENRPDRSMSEDYQAMLAAAAAFRTSDGEPESGFASEDSDEPDMSPEIEIEIELDFEDDGPEAGHRTDEKNAKEMNGSESESSPLADVEPHPKREEPLREDPLLESGASIMSGPPRRAPPPPPPPDAN